MSILYLLLSLKVAITIKVLQDQEYAPRSWLKFLWKEENQKYVGAAIIQGRKLIKGGNY